MKILYKKKLLVSIIFCIFVFLTSVSILNKIIINVVNENSEEQLISANKQNIEIANFKIKNILDAKMDIFIENLLEAKVIDDNILDNENLINLLKYYRKENFIAILGIIVEDKAVFINENDEVLNIEDKIIRYIITEEKSIFKTTISGEDYLVIKNELNDGSRDDIYVVYLHKNKSTNQDLFIPVYTDDGFSYIIDSDGQKIFYSTKNKAQFDLDNIFNTILSYSEKNTEVINKLRLDIINKKSGVIKYERPGYENRWMAYAPIYYEDLYLCTIIPNDIIEKNVDEIGFLNLISIVILVIDIVVLFAFFKFIEVYEKKKINSILDIDNITNGNSYKKFQEELEKIYNKKESKVIYLSIDLDNFKIVNTVLGKETGDYVLKKIYEILQFYIGDNGFYCRKNADVFLAYYKYQDCIDIKYIVDNICTAIRNIRLPKSHIIIPSVGIYALKDMSIPIENIEMNANIARKKSKNKINEFCSYFKDNNLNELVNNKNILDDMNNAIKKKEFKLVYQPKFDSKTKKIVGAEALIRWVKEDNSIVFPNQFIPIAEKTGFITFIDSYIFKEICKKQAEWINEGYNIVPISINMSREKLKDQNFLYEYLKIIGDVGLEKEYVELEITEGDTYSYDNVNTNIVDLIKQAGFKVLIDDFGVGYSSLTMLKNINADVLKLDRSFIIDDSSTGRDMVKYITKIAKLFNYKIVVEGVETEEQYNFLKDYCDEFQGYYFSKPLEEEEFIDKYLRDL